VTSSRRATTPPASGDEIRLEIPAQPEYGRLARVTVAGLALRLHFSHTEVEDLRLAVDEGLILLLDGSGHEGEVEILYRLLEGAIEVELTADLGRKVRRPSEAAIERFQSMVADLVDVAVADPAKRTVRFRKAVTGS
jgi:anti-sigma regulatory factor (Ser/Thr protein kinase)